jgi:aldehyde dehydrogenase (NAD+)
MGAESPVEYGLLIRGEQVPARAQATLSTIDPTTGRTWARLAAAGAQDVDDAVQAAASAQRSRAWRDVSASQRGRMLTRLGDLIAEHAEQIGRLETTDNGKLLRESIAQIGSVRDWLQYFGGLADKIEGSVIPLERQSVFNYTLREPLGPVAIITPWNTPTLLAMMAAAPAVAAGNTVVIKPSEVASVGTLRVAELAAEAGFPPGVFNVLTGDGSVGAALVDHPLVAKISFTGGTETGRAIAAKAGARLVRAVLELGGKSPNLVFADCELDAAVAGVLAGIFTSAGQSCVAGSRALVDRSIYDEFMAAVATGAEQIRIGDPLDSETQMGPLATATHREKVDGLVTRAREAGAELLAGGRAPDLPDLADGYFYEPTIVAVEDPSAEIACEEVFGPVLTVLPFEGEVEALELANRTRYGLAAGVWTLDVKRAHRVARELEAGTVWINMYRGLVPQSPFGGYKDSGVGRANGVAAIDEYLQTKSVWCELGG